MKILIYRQIDIQGEELASYWENNLDTCITSVTIKEANGSVDQALDLLHGYTMDCLTQEEIKQIDQTKRFIYQGWKE